MAIVNDLLHIAKQDLRIIEKNDKISKASDLLSTSRNRMIVVCDEDHKVAGVLTRGDILRGVYHENASSETHCNSLMCNDIHSCQATDNLNDVWSKMSSNNLNAMPVVDDEDNPLGVLSSKCVLVKLLAEARQQDELMRQYVDGMGYH